MKHLLAIRDLKKSDLLAILEYSKTLAPPRVLHDKGVALYFEKPSARTRNSMEVAVAQLGGHPVYLQPNELGIGTRETIADVTRTLACYHAIIAARVFDHSLLEQMATVNVRPILNMLSETDHPLQALADLMTIEQLLGHVEGARVTFIGEGNNVARSLAEACRAMGAEFTIASPTGYGFEGSLAGIREIRDPSEAVANADIIYSDVWVSMGAKGSDDRHKAFEPYQVNDALMANAPSAWFMHCLPAHRGEEVTASVIDGNRSAVWRQAENRLHSARGTMLWMLDQTL